MTMVITDEDGVERFKSNRIVSHLLRKSSVSLNEIWYMMEDGLFEEMELKEFYQLIGYSVIAYEELFGDG